MPVRRAMKDCCVEVNSRPRLLVGIRSHGHDAEHDIGLGEVLRRSKLLAIDADRGLEIPRREVRGEGVGQAERCGELGSKGAGAEQPDLDVRALARHRPHRLAGLRRFEKAKQFDHVLWEAVGAAGEVAAQRLRRSLIGPRRSAEA